MKDAMKYKGYIGSVHYSDEDSTFYGNVEFVKALISYEGDDVESLRNDFRNAVDDYLELCKAEEIEPERPFSGSFNVRTGSDLHRRASVFAREKGLNLNHIIKEALEHYIP